MTVEAAFPLPVLNGDASGLVRRLRELRRRHPHLRSAAPALASMGQAMSGGVGGCLAGRAFFNVDHRGRVSKCVEFRGTADRLGELPSDTAAALRPRLRPRTPRTTAGPAGMRRAPRSRPSTPCAASSAACGPWSRREAAGRPRPRRASCVSAGAGAQTAPARQEPGAEVTDLVNTLLGGPARRRRGDRRAAAGGGGGGGGAPLPGEGRGVLPAPGRAGRVPARALRRRVPRGARAQATSACCRRSTSCRRARDLRALRARVLEDNVVGFYDERPGKRRLYAVSDDRRFSPMNQVDPRPRAAPRAAGPVRGPRRVPRRRRLGLRRPAPGLDLAARGRRHPGDGALRSAPARLARRRASGRGRARRRARGGGAAPTCPARRRWCATSWCSPTSRDSTFARALSASAAGPSDPRGLGAAARVDRAGPAPREVLRAGGAARRGADGRGAARRDARLRRACSASCCSGRWWEAPDAATAGWGGDRWRLWDVWGRTARWRSRSEWDTDRRRPGVPGGAAGALRAAGRPSARGGWEVVPTGGCAPLRRATRGGRGGARLSADDSACSSGSSGGSGDAAFGLRGGNGQPSSAAFPGARRHGYPSGAGREPPSG